MTYTLTPNNPDPYTGLQNAYVGWHFIDGEDINTTLKWLKANTGWDYHVFAHPDDPAAQRLSLTKAIGNVETGTLVQFLVDETQWFTYDNGFINVLDDDDVTAGYTVADYILPDPPPVETPPPPPAMGMPPQPDS